jgi:uncharacterized membrane protein YciS (DUF1049 family)
MDNYATALIIACLMVIAYAIGWVVCCCKYRKRQKKVNEAAKNPVDYTTLTYDINGDIKQMGHELRELSRKGKGA